MKRSVFKVLLNLLKVDRGFSWECFGIFLIVLKYQIILRENQEKLRIGQWFSSKEGKCLVFSISADDLKKLCED